MPQDPYGNNGPGMASMYTVDADRNPGAGYNDAATQGHYQRMAEQYGVEGMQDSGFRPVHWDRVDEMGMRPLGELDDYAARIRDGSSAAQLQHRYQMQQNIGNINSMAAGDQLSGGNVRGAAYAANRARMQGNLAERAIRGQELQNLQQMRAQALNEYGNATMQGMQNQQRYIGERYGEHAGMHAQNAADKERDLQTDAQMAAAGLSAGAALGTAVMNFSDERLKRKAYMDGRSDMRDEVYRIGRELDEAGLETDTRMIGTASPSPYGSELRAISGALDREDEEMRRRLELASALSRSASRTGYAGREPQPHRDRLAELSSALDAEDAKMRRRLGSEQVLSPEERAAMDGIRNIKPEAWQYSPDAQRRLGLSDAPNVSPMAQNLAGHPVTASVVRDTPYGLGVDSGQATMQQYGMLSALGKRLDAIERERSGLDAPSPNPGVEFRLPEGY